MQSLLLFVGLFYAVALYADSSVTVPWQEFSDLYTERLETRIKKEIEPNKIEPVYVLDTASYQLDVSDTQIVGQADLEGRTLQGEPDEIPLYSGNIAVTDVKQSSGGYLGARADGYYLIPQKSSVFKTSLEFSALLTNDGNVKTFTLKPPKAVSNSLELSLPSHLRLLDNPFLTQAEGRWYFPPVETLTLRFQDLVENTGDQTLAINTLTRIEWHGAHMVATSYFQPVRRLSESFVIQLDKSATNIASSLTAESYNVAANGLVRVTPVSGMRDPFIVQYEIASIDSDYEIRLPKIENNAGREGGYFFRQITGFQITPITENDLSQIPAYTLPDALVSFASLTEQYRQLEAGLDTVSLRATRLPTAPVPALVLDTVHFYTSFVDNGDVYSVFSIKVPPRAIDKLTLNAIDGAEIWSVKVNDDPVNLYTDDERQWIIPLDEANASANAASIELAYVQRSEKLGLEGRLDVTVPATGLSARRLNVAVGVSNRVDVLSVDSDFEPAGENRNKWPGINQVRGKRLLLTKPFYRGRAINAAVYFKEPTDSKSEG